jgi:hypothetical protein
VECALRGLVEGLLLARNILKNSGPPVVESHIGDTGVPTSSSPVLHGGRFGFFRGLGGEAISPIFGDGPINDRTAVDAFPGIEGQEKIRESFQHHQSFALRTIHNFLPCEVNERRQGNSNNQAKSTT